MHDALVSVDGFGGVGGADGFEGGAVGDAGLGMGAAWRSEAVDHRIDLAEIGLDEVDGFVA